MAGLHPLKRREFIRRLRALGFVGPFRGARHEFLVYRQRRQTVPSNADFSVPQIKILLRQMEAVLGRKIDPEQWERLH